MKTFTLLFFFTGFILTSHFSLSQSNTIGSFIENKGQVLDFNENFHPEVKYYYSNAEAAVYFQQDRLVYNFKESEKLDIALLDSNRSAYEESLKTQKATYYRMDMVFQNSKSNVIITPGKQGQGVTHYYLNKRNGIRDVRSFETIKYENIYNQIDAIFYQSANGLKYDLILHEGANIEDIQLRFEGAEIKKVGDQLVISTLHSDITEDIPLSFIDGDKSKVVEVNYVLGKDGVVRFKLKKSVQYNTLTIDPILEWGSYYNGGTDVIHYGNNLLDDDGFYYTYGMAQNAASTYPVTNPGTGYAALHNASADAYFMQFNANRQLVWSSYLGGSGYEEIYNSNGIKVKGNTLHLVGERITAGAPFTNGGGFYEATVNRMFWARFNKTTGTLQHLTSLSNGYYPSIDISPTGQVVIACEVYNWNVFPLVNRPGAYNQATHGGSKDYGISLYNAAYNQTWGTYFGGPGSQEILYCLFDNSENIYFQGETSWFTASNPTSERLVQLPGAYYQSAIAGANDIALGKFNSSGQLVWNTLFGGNSSDARRGQQGSPGRILLHPTTNELLLAFNTTSSNLPIVNLAGAYNKTVPTHPDFAGNMGSYTNYAAYICKFSTAGVLNWGTYYYTGTGGGDLIENIAFGKCEKFYVGSAGVSTKVLAGATSGYNLLSGTSTSRTGYITMMSSSTFAREWDSYLNADVSYEANVAANVNLVPFYVGARLYGSNLPIVNPGNGAYMETSNSNGTGAGFGISQFHPSLPPDVLIPAPGCAGGSVTLTASGGMGAPYNWYASPSSTPALHTGATFTVSPTVTTTYYVSSGTGDCASPRIPVEVVVNPIVGTPPSISGTNSICNGSNTTLTIDNADPLVTYTWKTGSCALGLTFGTGTTQTVSPTTNTTYYVSYTDACGAQCLSYAVTVTQLVAGTASISQANFCGTTSANLTLTGHTGNIQWQQSTDGGTTWTDIAGAITTPYTVNGITVTTSYRAVLSSTGCTSVNSTVATITSTPAATPTVTITGAPTAGICSGTSVTFTANPTNGGTAPTYQWQINGVDVAGETGTTFTSTTLADNDVVTVIMTSNDPCATTPTVPSAGVTIFVWSEIEATITSTDISCGSTNDGTATVVISGGTAPFTYTWSPSGGTAATATGLVPGTYSVLINDASGCTKTLSTTINGTSNISVTTSSSPVDCGAKNGTATATVIGASGNVTYVWSPGNLTGSSINNLTVGTYTVTATDNSGCSATSTVIVDQNGSLNIQANPYSAVVEEGNSISLNASFSPFIAGSEYNWTPSTGLSCTDCPNPIATPSSTTTYNVMITTPDGCTADTNITLIFKMKCSELFVPTIFSPNGDGNNDEFKVYGKCIASIEMKIYDRWGELVFQSDDQGFGWDGTYKGQLMNSASFVYVIDVHFMDNSTEHLKGNVSLIR